MESIVANELRIGNLFNYDPKIKNFPLKPTSIDIDDIRLCQEGQWEWHQFYTPIPITEEWLLKFGFEKTSLGHFKKQGIILLVEDFYYICLLGNTSVIIKYVHQLQNLYFALTQKELTII